MINRHFASHYGKKIPLLETKVKTLGLQFKLILVDEIRRNVRGELPLE
jgi:hypothetical protein